jgi:hypothetical protein
MAGLKSSALQNELTAAVSNSGQSSGGSVFDNSCLEVDHAPLGLSAILKRSGSVHRR